MGIEKGYEEKNDFGDWRRRVHRHESVQEVGGVRCKESDNLG